MPSIKREYSAYLQRDDEKIHTKSLARLENRPPSVDLPRCDDVTGCRSRPIGRDGSTPPWI